VRLKSAAGRPPSQSHSHSSHTPSSAWAGKQAQHSLHCKEEEEEEEARGGGRATITAGRRPPSLREKGPEGELHRSLLDSMTHRRNTLFPVRASPRRYCAVGYHWQKGSSEEITPPPETTGCGCGCSDAGVTRARAPGGRSGSLRSMRETVTSRSGTTRHADRPLEETLR